MHIERIGGDRWPSITQRWPRGVPSRGTLIIRTPVTARFVCRRQICQHTDSLSEFQVHTHLQFLLIVLFSIVEGQPTIVVSMGLGLGGATKRNIGPSFYLADKVLVDEKICRLLITCSLIPLNDYLCSEGFATIYIVLGTCSEHPDPPPHRKPYQMLPRTSQYIIQR